MESAIQLFQRKFRRAKPSPKAESPIITRSREQSRDSAAVVIAKPAVNTRLLFFKECHVTKEQKVLYDSNQRLVARNHENQHHQHVAADWSRLSEIVFGSIGITRRSSSVLKIHQLRDSTQLMISHVFSTSMNSTDTGTQSLDRGMERMNGGGKMTQKNTSRRKARTMPAPLTDAAIAAANLSFDPASMVRSESILSLTNFISRSFQGSMKSYNSGKISPCCPCDSASNSDESSKKMSSKVKNFRLAFGLIFEPEPSDASCFNQFFFQHFPLFEHHLRQLKKSIESAVTFHHRAKPNFNAHDINEALDRFTLSLNNVYATPRLPEMVWAKLTWSPLPPDEVTVVKNCLIGDLSRLVLNFENNTVNKQRFNFTCSLITAVLTHHLGWVSSLITSPHANCLNEVERNDDDGQVEMYNTLWAQLRDLYGAVDYPTKMCKTVVTGSNHEIVSTVLAVLSYFIRSARVDDTIRIPEIITPESFERSCLPSYNDEIDPSINEALVHSEIEPHSEYVLISINKPPESSEPTMTRSSDLLKGRPRSHAFITDSSPRNCEPLSFGVFSQLRRSRRKAIYNHHHHHHGNQPHLSISPNTTFGSVSTTSSSSCGEKDETAPSSGEGNFCDFDDEPPSFMSLHHRHNHRKESPSSTDTDEYLTFQPHRKLANTTANSHLAPEIKISSSSDDSPPSYEAACCGDDVIEGRQSSSMSMLDDDMIDIEQQDNCSLKDGESVSHLMTSSSDFMSSYEEIPLDDVMSFESELEVTKDSEIATGFASLMADYNPCYLNDFVLQGVAKSPDQIKDDVVSDLKRTTEMSGSILDDDVDESCCVVADSDNWSVKIFSSKRADTDRPSLPSISSKLVHNLLLQTANMYQMKIEPTFCLQHLENCLRVVAMKSQTLARHVKGNGKRITTSQLSSALSIDKLDIPLLMAVSSCYSPMTTNEWL